MFKNTEKVQQELRRVSHAVTSLSLTHSFSWHHWASNHVLTSSLGPCKNGTCPWPIHTLECSWTNRGCNYLKKWLCLCLIYLYPFWDPPNTNGSKMRDGGYRQVCRHVGQLSAMWLPEIIITLKEERLVLSQLQRSQPMISWLHYFGAWTYRASCQERVGNQNYKSTMAVKKAKNKHRGLCSHNLL